MAFKTNDSKQKKNTETINFMTVGASVQNARVIGESCISFTLKCEGFSFYNMRLVEGRKGYFITPAQQKGKDGKWYNQYAVYLSANDEARLIQDVLKAAGVYPDDTEEPFE